MKITKLPEKLKKNNPRLYEVLKFIVKFNLLSIPLYIFLILNIEFVELQLATAQITETLLHATGVNAIRDGITLIVPVSGGFWSAQIIWDCIGWKSILLFLALVFATSFDKKKYALLFIPFIVLVNILRIWFMFFYVHNYGLANYDFIHAVVWSWGLLITVLLFWFVWLFFSVRHK